MIKLRDILHEGVQHIHITGQQGFDNYNAYMKHLDVIQKMTKHLKGTKVMYKGWKGKTPTGISYITQDTTGYKGDFVKGVTTIIKTLAKKFNFKSNAPTFVSFNVQKARKFGDVKIFVPKFPFTAIQSPEVDDIAMYVNPNIQLKSTKELPHRDVESKLDSIISQYKKTISNQVSDEVIIDIKDYYLLDIDRINRSLPKKLQNPNPTNYKDITDLIGKEMWITKKRKEEFDNR